MLSEEANIGRFVKNTKNRIGENRFHFLRLTYIQVQLGS